MAQPFSGVGIFAALSSTSLIARRNLLGPSSKVAVAKASHSHNFPDREITGIWDPYSRTMRIKRSLCSLGREWHRMMRSKSPARKRETASLTDKATSTIYPADLKRALRAPSNDESRPTERTTLSDIKHPNRLANNLQRTAPALSQNR